VAASTAPLSLPQWKTPAPATIVAGLAFLVLYAQPMATLGRDWWSDPDAGHGLLLAPLALVLAWRRGRAPNAAAQPALGLVLLIGAVLLRYLSGLAAELWTMRLSLIGAAAGLVVFAAGLRQLLHWWLPASLLVLSVPLPDVLTGTLAFPLQLKASQWGAALLELRHVPVRLMGNVIHLPGRSLFVTEACSGLRSLTALLALGLLIGGLWLRTPALRLLLIAAAIPVAMVLNAFRIFLTGFVVFYVDPALAEGVMHYSEGWVMFVVAFAILGAVAFVLSALEGRRKARSVPA
jgi:exosortase